MALVVRMLDIGAFKRFVTKDDMQAAGELALKLQAKRIAEGRGSRGSRMKKLSKGYADEEKGGSRVRTLRRTGAMLGSRAVLSVTEQTARIGFRNAPKYAYVNQAKTPFVKATKEERKLISRFIARRIRIRLRKLQAELRARGV